MKRIILLSMATVFALASAPSISGRHLTADEALAAVSAQVSSPASAKVKSHSATAARYTLSYSDSSLYVFNRSGNGGFIVVAADNAVDNLLLGYADSGSFDPANIPANMQWWLSQYGAEIRYAASNPVEKTAASRAADERPDIAPIVKTLWNQAQPYNALCPNINGVICPTGCVATAMAQAMKVFNWPEKGVGSNTYTPQYTGVQLSVDFGNTTYQWADMLNVYDSSSPASANSAVATLMYSCGVAVDMQYTADSSGANVLVAAKALVNYFNYDKSLACLSRDYYGLDEWSDIVYNELAEGRPVIYGGSNESSGHCFVADGYQSGDYFHINWGWGGSSNGYFLLTALDPEVQGIGGSASGYNTGQEIIVGIQRPVAGSTITPVVVYNGDFGTQQQSYARSESGTVLIFCPSGVFNLSIDTLNLTMGVKLTDEATGDVTYVWAPTPMQLESTSGIAGFTLPESAFPTSGSYIVTPAVKTADNVADAKVMLGHVDRLRLAADDQTLTFSDATQQARIVATDAQLTTPLYSGAQFALDCTLSNEGNAEYYKEVRTILVCDEEEVAVGPSIEVDLLPGETQKFEWVGSFNETFAPGEYQIFIVDASAVTLAGPIDVTVKATPTGKPVVETIQVVIGNPNARGQIAGNSPADPVFVDFDNVSFTVTLHCVSGYFAQNVTGYIFYDDTDLICGAGTQFVGLGEGDSKTVTFTCPLTDLVTDHVYMFVPWGETSGQLSADPYFFQSLAAGVERVNVDVAGIAITPNSAFDEAIITSADPISSVAIYSINGTLVATHAGEGATTVSIDMSGLTPGLYIVAVANTNGSLRALKFTKM